eukprot:4492693-Amphidinium_carterae.1
MSFVRWAASSRLSRLAVVFAPFLAVFIKYMMMFGCCLIRSYNIAESSSWGAAQIQRAFVADHPTHVARRVLVKSSKSQTIADKMEWTQNTLSV